MKHEDVYNRALIAIKDLYSDDSVSQEQTATDLKTLKYEIDALIETLE